MLRLSAHARGQEVKRSISKSGGAWRLMLCLLLMLKSSEFLLVFGD